jgi:mono/diheme cytochrome c family protein
MKYKALALAAGVAAVAVVGLAYAQQTRPVAAVLNVQAPDRAENFRLTDSKSFSHELYYFKNSAAVVIVSYSASSDFARDVLPAVQALKASYAGKNVQFFLLDSDTRDNRDTINAAIAAANIDIPVLIDDSQLVGESLGVSRVAQALVLQPSTWKVLYSGPVDDRFAGANPVRRAAARTPHLKAAIDAVIANQPVRARTVALTSPELAFPQRAHQAEFANISYEREIAPLLARNCVACHSEGGIGPFAMNSYEAVKGFAPMIREAIRTDRMPPYNADSHVGAFSGSMNLTVADTQKLVHWVEAGAPRGAGEDPLRINARPAPEWELGTPDYIITLPTAEVPASGVVDYQNPVVMNTLPEGRWLRASQVKAGDRRAVHHLLSNGVGGYAVGAETTVYPQGTGTWVAPGQRFQFQMHYTPYGRATTDTTRVGLYFYPKDAPPQIVRRSAVVLNAGIEIPPGEARHQEVAYLAFPADATLYTVFPHAHYRGENMQVFLQKPGQAEQLILSLPHYDFNWQRGYDFATPMQIPAGSKIITRYQYDNSANNRANPDPTITVRWGEQSFEEMQYTALGFRWNDETATEQKPEHMTALNASRMMGMLDSNIDGKVARTELRGRQGQALLTNFDRLDADHDGFLTNEEMAIISGQVNRRIDAAQAQQSVGQ